MTLFNDHSWNPGKCAQVPLYGLSWFKMIGRPSGTAEKSLNVLLCSPKLILERKIIVFFKKRIWLWILFFHFLAELFLNADSREFFSPWSPGSPVDLCCRAPKPSALPVLLLPLPPRPPFHLFLFLTVKNRRRYPLPCFTAL